MPKKQKRGAAGAASKPSRREFLRTSAVLSATALAGGCATTPKSQDTRAAGKTTSEPQEAPAVHPSGGTPPPIRVGLVGCGGRGLGATIDCVNAAPNVEVIALSDLFVDKLVACRSKLEETIGDAFKITGDCCFAGFDAYFAMMSCDVDLIILATPPHFRPLHLTDAIEAGKHVFMEKPVAVDPAGVRTVLGAAELAEQKGLAIVAGTQRRHDPYYVETMKRIRDGAIGEIVAAQCYWNQGALWVERAEENWQKHEAGEYKDMEWHCRNWLFHTWLSGDHIVEQHVHNLDVVNWAMGGPPVKCVGMGGRQVRTEPKYGNVFDHFAVEYEYANGARASSMCRQIGGCSDRVGERLVGTRGSANPHGDIMGDKPFKYEAPGEAVNPYVQEHADLLASIRTGQPLNEARRIAESTMTAIMGRMSAYTGREVSWNWAMNASKLEYKPVAYSIHAPVPDTEIAVPGETELV